MPPSPNPPVNYVCGGPVRQAFGRNWGGVGVGWGVALHLTQFSQGIMTTFPDLGLL